MGSPRSHGNTSILLLEAIKALNDDIERETIDISRMDIQGCRGCELCRQDGACVIQDDMQTLYPMIERADGIILASPTYFYNVTASMKAFIERMYCYERFHPQDRSVWSSFNEMRGGRYAVSITVCEQDDEYDMGFASDAMDRSLQALGYRVVDSVRVFGAYDAGAVSEHTGNLELARKAGRRLSMMLDMIPETNPKQ